MNQQESSLNERILELKKLIKKAKKDLDEFGVSIEQQVWWAQQIKEWKNELKILQKEHFENQLKQL